MLNTVNLPLESVQVFRAKALVGYNDKHYYQVYGDRSVAVEAMSERQIISFFTSLSESYKGAGRTSLILYPFEGKMSSELLASMDKVLLAQSLGYVASWVDSISEETKIFTRVDYEFTNTITHGLSQYYFDLLRTQEEELFQQLSLMGTGYTRLIMLVYRILMNDDITDLMLVLPTAGLHMTIVGGLVDFLEKVICCNYSQKIHIGSFSNKDMNISVKMGYQSIVILS